MCNKAKLNKVIFIYFRTEGLSFFANFKVYYVIDLIPQYPKVEMIYERICFSLMLFVDIFINKVELPNFKRQKPWKINTKYDNEFLK